MKNIELNQQDKIFEAIVLGGGCFWCTEAIFRRVQGVVSVRSGYANGSIAHPTYEQVCSGTTGHAEVVQIVFDPAQIPLRALLEIFFAIHDPTTLNRQGNDVGTQYRSGIYCTDAAQEALARVVLQELVDSQSFGAAIVTEVEPLRCFWPAEDYHGDYFERNPQQGYCAYVVAPKVEKFRHSFARYLRRNMATGATQTGASNAG